MNIEQITDGVEVVFERARDALDREVVKHRKVIDALNAERQTAQAMLARLKDEHKRVQGELDTMIKQLDRASDLSVLDFEIKKGRKELAELKVETEKVSVALTGLRKERADGEARAAALRTEASQWAAARTETEAALRRIRERLL